MIENLVTLKNKKPITTSLIVAEAFGKNHQHVLRSIRELGCSYEFNQSNFGLVEYIDAKGEYRPMYEMTHDGFAILVMGFTGQKAMAWKERFIAAFNELERQLHQSDKIVEFYRLKKENPQKAGEYFYHLYRACCIDSDGRQINHIWRSMCNFFMISPATGRKYRAIGYSHYLLSK